MLSAAVDHKSYTDDILAEYNYQLPPELIAQTPARLRTAAKMMLVDRNQNTFGHDYISGLIKYLKAGDLLVLNNTRVVPARILAQKDTGGAVEVFLLSPARPLACSAAGRQVHEVLLKGKNLQPGRELFSPGQAEEPAKPLLRICGRKEYDWPGLVEGPGKAIVELYQPALEICRQYGLTPLPPYIKRAKGPRPEDQERYQTVYAQKQGAVAAPTAGLHFSKKLLTALQAGGVQHAFITLHVGYGTFARPDAKDLNQNRLHAEWVEISPEFCRQYAQIKGRGRIIAVGTTSLRAMEWWAASRSPEPKEGWCDLLIKPGFDFKAAEGLITNFHLPRTTLLMLVSALAGRDKIMAAYAEAVRQRYRFYSYGDAMLII